MSEFNHVPIKIETEGEGEPYTIHLGHHDDYGDEEMLSPTEGGEYAEYPDYMDGGGGKQLRLKRRRKCGQCGPCQVKENCNKCHYCMRRDVLKQSCIYRKCLYLRKKQLRVRSESFEGTMQSPQEMVQSMLPVSPPVMCVSPDQGSIQSPTDTTSFCLPQPNSVYTSPVSATSPSATSPLSGPSPLGQSPQAASPDQNLDPLRGYQSPDNVRPFSHDSMRSHSAERPKSHQSDTRPMSTDGVRSSPASHGPMGMSSAQAEFLRQMPMDPYQVHMQRLQHIQNSQLSKEQIRPRTFDQLRHLSPEQYGPYGPARHMMPPHGIPYAFTPSNIPSASASPLGLPQACRYSIPPQASFHPHLAYNPSLRPPFNTTPPSSSIMAPPFYPPPPPHGAPTSLPNLPLGQYPSPHQRAYPPGGFAAPHPALYPGGIYPPFRPPNEPYIYHAHFPHPASVFSEHAGHMARFRDHYLRNSDDEEDCKKFDIFRLTKKTDTELMREKYVKESGRTSVDSISSEPEDLTSRVPTSKPLVDYDLRQQMNNISRLDPCNVTITIDDLKMQAFVRSDGANNLEIEIESPTSSASTLSPNSKSPSKEPGRTSPVSRAPSKSNHDSAAKSSDILVKQMPCLTRMLRRKQTLAGTVCLKQDLGDEGIMQLELPGYKVQLENLLLDDKLLMQSDNPSELLKFISNPMSSNFPETIIIH